MKPLLGILVRPQMLIYLSMLLLMISILKAILLFLVGWAMIYLDSLQMILMGIYVQVGIWVQMSMRKVAHQVLVVPVLDQVLVQVLEVQVVPVLLVQVQDLVVVLVHQAQVVLVH